MTARLILACPLQILCSMQQCTRVMHVRYYAHSPRIYLIALYLVRDNMLGRARTTKLANLCVRCTKAAAACHSRAAEDMPKEHVKYMQHWPNICDVLLSIPRQYTSTWP